MRIGSKIFPRGARFSGLALPAGCGNDALPWPRSFRRGSSRWRRRSLTEERFARRSGSSSASTTGFVSSPSRAHTWAGALSTNRSQCNAPRTLSRSVVSRARCGRGRRFGLDVSPRTPHRRVVVRAGIEFASMKFFYTAISTSWTPERGPCRKPSGGGSGRYSLSQTALRLISECSSTGTSFRLSQSGGSSGASDSWLETIRKSAKQALSVQFGAILGLIGTFLRLIA